MATPIEELMHAQALGLTAWHYIVWILVLAVMELQPARLELEPHPVRHVRGPFRRTP